MSRASIVCSLLGLSLAVAACDPEEDGPDGGGDAGTMPREDGGPPTEDGGSETPARTWTMRPVTVSPWTLPQDTGGSVEVTLVGEVTDADGARLSIDEVVAEGGFVAELPDGTTLEIEATGASDGEGLTAAFTVPGGMAPAGARLAVAIRADDALVAEAPLSLHADPTERLAASLGDRTGHLGPAEIGDLAEICSMSVVDADADGVFEVVMLGIDGADRPVFRGCVGFTDPDSGGWECQDDTLDPALEAGEGLLCGETDHFMTSGGTAGIGGVMTTTADRPLAVRNLDWNGREWGAPGTSTSLGHFAVVIGINTSKERGAEPLESVLEMRPLGGGGWTGVVIQSDDPFEWGDLDGVTPDMLVAGDAWAGLFTPVDLRRTTGPDTPTPPSWAWVGDQRASDTGDGELWVSTLRVDPTAGGFALRRRVTLGDPGFTADAMAAAGEDLDGDGVPELVVEAWGDGAYAAWLIPSATNEDAVSPVTRLRSRATGAGAFGAPVRMVADGAVVRATSSFSATLDGTLRAVRAIPDGPRGGTDAVPQSVLYLMESWAVSDALSADVAEATASGLGWLGRTRRTSPRGSTGHGVCTYGKCFCVAGGGGITRLPSGGGDGSTVSTVLVDNPTFIPPGGVVQSGLGGDGGVVLIAPAGGGATTSVALGLDADGFTARVDGTDVAAADASARFALARGREPSDLAVFVFEPRVVAAGAGGLGDAPQETVVTVDVRVRYADATGAAQLPAATTTGGTSVPVLLDDAISPAGGVLLGWRDGAGQAWMGVLDVAGAAARTEGELPFLQGPVAIGEPTSDPEGALGLTLDQAGMVGPPTRSAGASRYFDALDAEGSTAGWDAPPEGGFTQTDAAYGPVMLVVGGTEAGSNQVVYVPAIDDLAGRALQPVVTGVSNDALPVPRLAASLLPDAPPVVVSTSASGTLTLDLVDDVRPLARHTTAAAVPTATRGEVSAGDLNGDGLADLVIGAGPGARIWASDGTGEALDVALPPAARVNLAGFAGGADRTREAAVDTLDGGTFGPPRTVFGVATLDVDDG